MEILNRLAKSKFRSKFHLSDKDKKYVELKGLDTIKKHAEDFIEKRLKIKPKNDGKQTPYKGHPVFVAQHATATCCRECIYKWHKILPNKELNNNDVAYLTSIIMEFIKREI